MSLLWKWWKESPEYIAAILIGLVAISTLSVIYGGNDGPDCSAAYSQWNGEVADANAFWGFNRSDPSERPEIRREWVLEHRDPDTKEQFMSIMDAGHALSELQDCMRSDEDLRRLSAPTKRFSDEEKMCFDRKHEGHKIIGGKFVVDEECKPILRDAAPRIA
ncbi:MAG: hypothetical protein KTV68_05530 [Acidimicrobiia bacterium]|nr:hypothetical protein [Acidimicrobiia bacterium]MCY4433394.1 hypothetical protein [bacterium]